MSYFTCDTCSEDNYTEANPFVEVRIPRPSDPADLCAILGGHLSCFGGVEGETVRTPEHWDEYIESEAAYAAGHLFLT